MIHPAKAITAQMYRKASGYKPWLFNTSVDICQYLKRPHNPIAIMIIKMIRRFTNFNHTCPYVVSKPKEIQTSIPCTLIRWRKWPTNTLSWYFLVGHSHLEKLYLLFMASSIHRAPKSLKDSTFNMKIWQYLIQLESTFLVLIGSFPIKNNSRQMYTFMLKKILWKANNISRKSVPIVCPCFVITLLYYYTNVDWPIVFRTIKPLNSICV